MASWYLLLLGVFSIFSLAVSQERINQYENHTLVSLFPTNSTQLAALQYFEDPDIDVLKRSHGYHDSLDLLVPPQKLSTVQKFAADYAMIFSIKEQNYGRKFATDVRASRRYLRAFNIFGFNSYASMQGYLDTVAKRHPDLVTLETLGDSYEGRRMRLVKISSAPQAGNPIIMIDAGVHAREWVAPAMALYAIHRLTRDPGLRELDGVDWYILPLVNPDGYEFTRSSPSNRMWRKTRSKSPGGQDCYGVDGNRNYGFQWGVSGVSNNPCDKETYAGPKPFSEPETRMVRQVMMEYADRIKLYVSLHSYGNYLVYPWGYTGEFLPTRWKNLDSLAHKVSYAIQRAGGRPLKVLSAGKWYAAAGGSDDFAFGAIGIPYSYTMELTDGYEFDFPESLLKTALPQFYEGFKAFAAEISSEFNRGRYKRSVKQLQIH